MFNAGDSRSSRDPSALPPDLRDEIGRRPRSANLVKAEDDVVRPRGIDRLESVREHPRRGGDRRGFHVGMRPVLGAPRREPVPVPRPDND